MTTTKITKKAQYAAIKDILAANGADDLVAFVDHEIELLDNKAASAAKRAATKKAEGDALREAVYNVLSPDEFMTIAEVTAVIVNSGEFADITEPKVRARLTQLAKEEVGLAEKGVKDVPTSDGKGRKLAAYRRLG